MIESLDQTKITKSIASDLSNHLIILLTQKNELISNWLINFSIVKLIGIIFKNCGKFWGQNSLIFNTILL